MEFIVVFKIFIFVVACLAGLVALKSIVIDDQMRFLSLFLFILPFCTGGFSFTGCTGASVLLLYYLYKQSKAGPKLFIRISDTTFSVAVLTLCYGLTALWAADRGMAAWGIVRYLPVLLFMCCLMQINSVKIQEVYRLVPLSATIMTIATCVMQHIPVFADMVTVDGRLAGFFEYPNTYAAFLIVALVISGTEQNQAKWNIVQDTVLIFGVFQSGSRTGFLVLIGILIVLILVKRDKYYAVGRIAIFAGCVAASILFRKFGVESSADRYLSISGESSTMLGRLLYFSDALRIIVKHPLGLGYLGYHAIQGSIQTGVYDVTHVHNWLLQLLLDVGWIPTLIYAWVVIRSFFSKYNSWRNRLIILAILGHGMMDFDMEYLVMWLLLLPALDYGAEKPIQMKNGRTAVLFTSVIAIAICGWLTLGDCLYRFGQLDLCLKITPFHTQALEYRLAQTTDPAELDKTANRILKLTPCSSIAYSAKANAAYVAGDVNTMILSKQKAIENSKYQLVEYCDYFDKVYEAMIWYRENGDVQSAEACAVFLNQIPEMLEQVKANTSPLAWRLSDKPELELPVEYRTLLAEIAGLT